MENNFASFIIPGAKVIRSYTERLLKGITPEIFARIPTLEGQQVKINHPAFNLGHLSLYPARLSTFLPLPEGELKVPDNYETLFKDGTPCHDDPKGIEYPKMDEIVANYFRANDKLLECLGQISNSVFFSEMPDEKRRERFPTVGSFANYIILAHPNTHLGQISSWRRCMGLGPA